MDAATHINAAKGTLPDIETILTTYDTNYAWNYGTVKEGLRDLYEKAKREQWNGSVQLAWDTPVDPQGEIIPQSYNPLEGYAPFERLDAKGLNEFRHATISLQLSQFMHGEQGALLATAQIVNTVPWTEGKFYAANQVADEARHVEVYRRYLTEKWGITYPVNPHLHTLLNQIIGESRWDMIYLGMQIMVEGLALAAFGLMKFTKADEPLIQQITAAVMRDEARHVAFGVLSLQDLYTKELSSTELREREEFVIEATVMMRDRLLMEEVWPRIGLDAKVWMPWALTTPFMVGFRQILFSKIVPNLKRLGLLTPRVRAKFAELDILQYETLPDSTQDEDTAIPPALMTFFANLQAAGIQFPAAG